MEFNKKNSSAFYTIWLDLTIKKEKLWENLNKQCRYDIKRAKKLGVVVEKSKSLDDLNAFYQICESIGKTKGFSLGYSWQLMSNLLSSKDQDQIESYLFIARYQDTLCGGVFLVRCGESAHYFWGAVNRKFSNLCVGEALQWECIEWALSKDCKKYDLEGLSQKQNSGVDQFKKKFGGSIVAYPCVKIHPLHLGRKVVLSLGKIYLMLQPQINNIKNFFQ